MLPCLAIFQIKFENLINNEIIVSCSPSLVNKYCDINLFSVLHPYPYYCKNILKKGGDISPYPLPLFHIMTLLVKLLSSEMVSTAGSHDG